MSGNAYQLDDTQAVSLLSVAADIGQQGREPDSQRNLRCTGMSLGKASHNAILQRWSLKVSFNKGNEITFIRNDDANHITTTDSSSMIPNTCRRRLADNGNMSKARTKAQWRHKTRGAIDGNNCPVSGWVPQAAERPSVASWQPKSKPYGTPA